MRHLLTAIFVCLLAANVFGLTALLDTNSFLKGQSISVSGLAAGEVVVSAKLGNREIFEQKVKADSSGKYNFSRSVGYLDPTGNWKLNIKDAIEQIELPIMIYPSRPSEFLSINVLSPSTEKFARGDKIKLNIYVTDAGKPVEDATVVFWDSIGVRQLMINQKKGYFIAETNVPADAELGKWWLYFTAESTSKGQTIGGEITIELEIVQSLITLEVIEPKFQEIKLGSSIPIRVRATYSDGLPIQNPVLFASVRDQKFSLQKFDEDIFEGNYTPRGEDAGLLQLKIVATDSLENHTEKVLPITVSGFLEWFVVSNILWIGTIVIILGFLLFTSTEKLYVIARHRLLEAKKLALIEEKKHVQSKYFKHGSISKDTYRDKEIDLSTQISQLEAEIFQLNARMADIKANRPNFNALLESLGEFLKSRK